MSSSKESAIKVIYQFPTLFKKTSNGAAIQFWQMEVSEIIEDGETMPVGELKTIYGQYGTSSPQETRDLISEGKNPGKKNGTTPVEQALKEAKAQWTKKKKKGYVESVASAEAEELDSLIEGGMEPMLAHKFSEQGHKIVYPCYAQPKLDGIRCVAIVKNGKCTLWTRTRKPILSCPHIINAIEHLGPKNMVLDGELYTHEHKNNFEAIVSAVRKEYPSELSEKIEYHIYDIAGEVSSIGFHGRKSIVEGLNLTLPLVAVETKRLMSEDAVLPYFEEKRKEGYEGIMLRNEASEYVNKRSYDLQKVKEFDDAEFEIVGIEEGRGKFSNLVSGFVCLMPNGKDTFSATANGSLDFLADCFKRHEIWKGRTLVVQYQGFTKYGKPRFARGIRFRDSEDF